MIVDKDLEDLAKLQFGSSHECPNLYGGGNDDIVSEKFIIKQSVTISKKNSFIGKKSLKITLKDLKKLNKPRTKGSYGRIHFLQDYSFENSDDNFKDLFVVKVQDRNFDFKAYLST